MRVFVCFVQLTPCETGLVTALFAVINETPRASPICLQDIPEARISAALSREKILAGRPQCFPWRFASAIPAVTLAIMIFRSNWASRASKPR